MAEFESEEYQWTTTRKIRQIGGSLNVSLPPMFTKINKLKPGQFVRVEFDLNRLTIVPIVDKALTEQQLVVFDLNTEAYGVDIGAVREIIHLRDITRVPGIPDFVEGVINLRGKVTPVVDLRKKLGLTVAEKSAENRIMVMDIAGQDIGMVVDAVTEVLRISAGAVEHPSGVIASTTDRDYIRGIAKLDERLIILLDLEKVFSLPERQKISMDTLAA